MIRMGGGAIDIMNLLYGTAFERFASLGQLPPPGPAFLNRFCHKSFDDWADDYREAMHDPSDDQLATSFDRLILALIELETKIYNDAFSTDENNLTKEDILNYAQALKEVLCS